MSDWRSVTAWERLEALETGLGPTACQGIAEIPASNSTQAKGTARGATESGPGIGLIAAAERVAPGDVAGIARLRKQFDAELVGAALELVAARRKAAAKFPGQVLWCDVQGVEQASGALVAAWKARRMRETLGAGAPVLDLCCGIGGDAMALAQAGLSVTAVDLDPRRAWMAARNAGCAVEVADVETLELRDAAIHVDPARRDESAGRRSWNLDDHRPGRAWIERALRETRAAAIKFSPGVDRQTFRGAAIEWEWIAERGALVQAVAWSGAFARDARQTVATALDDGCAESLAGTPDDARPDRLPIDAALPRGSFVCEPIAAVERARLLTAACAESAHAHAADPSCPCEIAPGLGLVRAHEPLKAPWFESFEVVAEARPDARQLREILCSEGLVARSVRVRGGACDADLLTRELDATPAGDAVIFAFRQESRARAVVARARR